MLLFAIEKMCKLVIVLSNSRNGITIYLLCNFLHIKQFD